MCRIPCTHAQAVCLCLETDEATDNCASPARVESALQQWFRVLLLNATFYIDHQLAGGKSADAACGLVDASLPALIEALQLPSLLQSTESVAVVLATLRETALPADCARVVAPFLQLISSGSARELPLLWVTATWIAVHALPTPEVEALLSARYSRLEAWADEDRAIEEATATRSRRRADVQGTSSVQQSAAGVERRAADTFRDALRSSMPPALRHATEEVFKRLVSLLAVGLHRLPLSSDPVGRGLAVRDASSLNVPLYGASVAAGWDFVFGAMEEMHGWLSLVARRVKPSATVGTSGSVPAPVSWSSSVSVTRLLSRAQFEMLQEGLLRALLSFLHDRQAGCEGGEERQAALRQAIDGQDRVVQCQMLDACWRLKSALSMTKVVKLAFERFVATANLIVQPAGTAGVTSHRRRSPATAELVGRASTAAGHGDRNATSTAPDDDDLRFVRVARRRLAPAPVLTGRRTTSGAGSGTQAADDIGKIGSETHHAFWRAFVVTALEVGHRANMASALRSAVDVRMTGGAPGGAGANVPAAGSSASTIVHVQLPDVDVSRQLSIPRNIAR